MPNKKQKSMPIAPCLIKHGVLSVTHLQCVLQALKRSIYNHEDYAFIFSSLSTKKKWTTKEKKARLLRKFIATMNDSFIGANQQLYDLVLKEVKQSG
jgi:hypothetical protein